MEIHGFSPFLLGFLTRSTFRGGRRIGLVGMLRGGACDVARRGPQSWSGVGVKAEILIIRVTGTARLCLGGSARRRRGVGVSWPGRGHCERLSSRRRNRNGRWQTSRWVRALSPDPCPCAAAGLPAELGRLTLGAHHWLSHWNVNKLMYRTTQQRVATPGYIGLFQQLQASHCGSSFSSTSVTLRPVSTLLRACAATFASLRGFVYFASAHRSARLTFAEIATHRPVWAPSPEKPSPLRVELGMNRRALAIWSGLRTRRCCSCLSSSWRVACN